MFYAFPGRNSRVLLHVTYELRRSGNCRNTDGQTYVRPRFVTTARQLDKLPCVSTDNSATVYYNNNFGDAAAANTTTTTTTADWNSGVSGRRRDDIASRKIKASDHETRAAAAAYVFPRGRDSGD